MDRKKLGLSIIGIMALALAAIAAWLAGLWWETGGSAPGWLWSAQYAAFVVNFFVVLAYLLPVHMLGGLPWSRLFLPGLQLFFTAVIAFFIAKSILYSLFLPIAVFDLSPLVLRLMLGVLGITTAGSFYYLTRNHLYPVKPAFVALMVGAQLLTLALCLLTAGLVYGFLPWDVLLITSVRNGFPFFYFTLLIGLCSIVSIWKLSKQEERREQEEILDDMMM